MQVRFNCWIYLAGIAEVCPEPILVVKYASGEK
jgi:hypothetical protein